MPPPVLTGGIQEWQQITGLPKNINVNIKMYKKQAHQYRHLSERYEEMSDYLPELTEEHRRAWEDMRYMNDFIHSKALEEEFSYFRKHALEDTETELPFPYLVL